MGPQCTPGRAAQDGNLRAVNHRFEWPADGDGDELDALVALSNAVGADAALTQPGGGNSSIKRRARDFAGREVEVLSVKGSGTDLATIKRTGFTTLRLADLALLQARDQ